MRTWDRQGRAEDRANVPNPFFEIDEVLALKRLKILSALAILLCVIGGIYFGLIRFNTDMIGNVTHHRPAKKIDSASVTFEGWETTNGVYVTLSGEASIVVELGETTEVHNLLIDGSFQAPDTMKVYAIDENGQAAEVTGKGSKQNEDYLLRTDVEAVTLRIVPFERAGETMELGAITVNPRRLHINTYAILAFILLGIVSLVAIDFIVDRAEIVREIRAMIRYRYLVQDLVTKDIKTKYRRSVLGLLWSVLNPLLMMLVLTAVFSTIFNYKSGDFSVYYLTGYIMFNFVTEATTFSMTSIIGSAGLIKKVYIPKLVFPLEKCMFALVNMLFSLIAAIIVFLVVGVQPHWVILLFPLPIFYLFVFNFGISLILATLNTFFRDVGYLYNVFITIWMYLTPIIYPVSILPSWLLPIVKLNPLYHYVQYFRNVTIYGVMPSLKDNLICISISLLFLLIGVRFFRKKQDQFIFYI